MTTPPGLIGQGVDLSEPIRDWNPRHSYAQCPGWSGVFEGQRPSGFGPCARLVITQDQLSVTKVELHVHPQVSRLKIHPLLEAPEYSNVVVFLIEKKQKQKRGGGCKKKGFGKKKTQFHHFLN